ERQKRMGLFNSRRPSSEERQPPPSGQLPLLQFDLSKRYDIYYIVHGVGVTEERVYPNVRFLAIRTFERITEYSSGIGGFLEVETIDGTRYLLPHFGITSVCEHGTKPGYRVIERCERM